MKVLIVNDDGIDSEGLRILAERVGKKHEVYVLAPDSNRSATSHHILMFQDLELKKYKKNQWSCSGMPADCTNIALKTNLFNVKFDVVLSGINCGANMGTDIVYSGTCAGAREAVLEGLPGIAVSLVPLDWEEARKNGFKYVALADFVASNLENLALLSSEKYPGTFVNINAASVDSYRGVKIANKIIVRKYKDNLEIIKNASGTFSHFNPSGSLEVNESENTDCSAVSDGYIAISCVYAEPVTADIVDGITFKV